MESGWSSPRFSPGDKLYRIATRADVSCVHCSVLLFLVQYRPSGETHGNALFPPINMTSQMSLTTINKPDTKYFVGDTIKFNMTLRDWFGEHVNASERSVINPLEGISVTLSGSGGTQYAVTVDTDPTTGDIVVSRRVTMEGTYFFEIRHYNSLVASFTDSVKNAACRNDPLSNICKSWIPVGAQ